MLADEWWLMGSCVHNYQIKLLTCLMWAGWTIGLYVSPVTVGLLWLLCTSSSYFYHQLDVWWQHRRLLPSNNTFQGKWTIKTILFQSAFNFKYYSLERDIDQTGCHWSNVKENQPHVTALQMYRTIQSLCNRGPSSMVNLTEFFTCYLKFTVKCLSWWACNVIFDQFS